MFAALIPLISTILGKVIPDAGAADAAKLELLKLAQAGDMAELNAQLQMIVGQLDINKAEAASTSWFVAGWRPWSGWVCGMALAYVAIVEPFARFVAAVWFGYKGPFPAIDTNLTMQVLLGMLGLAGARTFEKTKGAEGNR